jgi:hypothetical protein
MLYIVTPLSRVENFHILLENIKPKISQSKIYWVVIKDQILTVGNTHYISYHLTYQENAIAIESNTKKALAGHAHRNYFVDYFYNKLAIEKSNSDWVYFLDDDTLLHPDFLETIIPLLENNLDKAAIIFDQENKDGTMRLFANINQVKVCHIDMGQYLVNLSLLPNDLRFKEDDYCADGIFIEELFNRVGPEQFLVVNKTLSIYNKLR